MREMTTKVYAFDELSDKAKEKALAKWNETNDDPLMQSHMINLLKEKLDERSIKYDVDSIDVRYSLSHCQGDGFMFIGKVMWRGKEITITHGDSTYYHMDTARFDYEGKDEYFDQFKAVYEAICKEMERIGYEYIEYVQSMEQFMEACETNGYEFTSEGELI